MTILENRELTACIKGVAKMKLNRDDIIKALECGVRQNCDGCPLYDALGDSDGACLDIMPPNILSLIKELVEENERLMREKTALECVVATARNQAKNDTVRKMQERLEAACDAPHWCVWLSEIDEIAKEMLEDSK